MSRRRRRVVKVGGSLFDLEAFSRCLNDWLDRQPPALNVLIAGGGGWADLVRSSQRPLGLDDEFAHWLCIDAMSLTARMLARLIDGAQLVRDWGLLQRDDKISEVATVVFDCRSFLRDEELREPGTPTPRNWLATSDSIAARVAACLGAEELVLLKSALPPARAAMCDFAGDYVDRHFPLAARDVPLVRCVNLRQDGFPQRVLSRRERTGQSESL